MEALLASLNDAQRAAVTSKANVLQVLAPPGSGKTKTLTARVSYLITACSIQPWNILICTFTVKAAKEMRERIVATVGEALAKKLILGTFHSVARRFLVSYGHYIGLGKTFGIADTNDSKAIIKRIIKDNQLSIEPSRAQARISSQKAKSITSEQYAASARKGVNEQEFTIVYSEYEAALQTSNILDYDDLLLRCAFLLRSNPQCVANIQAVLIDEFQDTNEVQFDLMTLFAQHKRTITIVGDPDQSIYGWRNAEIKNLETMKQHYPDTLVHFLEENYRSSGAILAAAQAVIEQDDSRPAKRLQATHVHGEMPVLRRLPTAENEARWLVEEIQRTQALTGNMLQYGDYAILLRSASVSRHIEAALGNAGVPYRMVGGTKFYDRVEVKTMLDYLRVVNQPEHNDAVLRILNIPARGIGEVTVKNLLTDAQRNKVPLWDVLLGLAQGTARCRTKLSSQAQRGLVEFVGIILSSRKKLSSTDAKPLTPADLVEFLVRKLKFEDFLRQKYPEDFDARWANVTELRTQMEDLTVAMAESDDMFEEENLPVVDGVEQRTVVRGEDALSVFLGNIALSSDVQKKTEEQVEESQCVTISTIHAAKGLEWPVVFIPACYTGSIPHSRAEDHDEERRLLYVGMTRAQAMLYLSCPSKNSQTQETTISSFLTDGVVTENCVAQGPKLGYYAVSQLAQTLRRTLPDFEIVESCRKQIETLADDRWPIDGTGILEDEDRWQYGRANARNERSKNVALDMAALVGCAGFVSAASIPHVEGFSLQPTNLRRADSRESRAEGLDGIYEESALRKIDARKNSAGMVKKGSRSSKAAAGTASIASYFGGSSTSTKIATKIVPAGPRDAIDSPYIRPPDPVIVPLEDATMRTINDTRLPRSYNPESMIAKHKLSTKPTLHRLPGTRNHDTECSEYMNVEAHMPSENKKQKTETGLSARSSTCAASESVSSFHVTTMSQIGKDQHGNRGKTLGLARGFVPWSARARR